MKNQNFLETADEHDNLHYKFTGRIPVKNFLESCSGLTQKAVENGFLHMSESWSSAHLISDGIFEFDNFHLALSRTPAQPEAQKKPKVEIYQGSEKIYPNE